MFTKYKINDFLKRVRYPVQIKDEQTYQLVTIRTRHKGVTLRSSKPGVEIGTKTMYAVKLGQFILSGIDARHGAFGIVPDELDGAVVTNDFWYFDIDETVIDKEFFLYLSSTPYFDNICRLASDGTTNRVRLQAAKFFNVELSLPPLNEQQLLLRQHQQSEAKLIALNHELDHQNTLLTQLQQAILQDAVQGRLTKRFREKAEVERPTETGADLLARIRAEKAALIAAKKLRKEKLLPPITEDEKPFDLPDGWVWIRLGEVCDLITSGSRDWAQHYSDSPGVKFVRMGNLSKEDYKMRLDKIAYVKAPNGEGTRTRLEENDILISITGEVGHLGLIPPDFGEAYINQHTSLVRLNKNVDILYFANFLRSLSAKKQFDEPQRGMKNSFRLSDVGLMKIPFPSIAEQQAIVSAVERAVEQVGALRAELVAQRQTANELLRALLHRAFGLDADVVGEEETVDDAVLN